MRDPLRPDKFPIKQGGHLPFFVGSKSLLIARFDEKLTACSYDICIVVPCLTLVSLNVLELYCLFSVFPFFGGYPK